jgi:hypothetical protein
VLTVIARRLAAVSRILHSLASSSQLKSAKHVQVLSRKVTAMSTDTTTNQPADTDHTVTRYTRDTDTESHSKEVVNGHHVDVDANSTTTTRTSGEFDNRVMQLINGVIEERERRENERANHRNLNRMLTLFGALIIGLIVTWMLNENILGHDGKILAPYSFVITILMDSGLALYGYIKHY